MSVIAPRSLLDPRSVDEKQLRQMPEDALRPVVLASLGLWLDGGRAGGFVDGESLDYFGMLIGRSGHRAMDRLVCEWTRSGGSADHLFIAGWWLGGYWAHCESIDQGCVEQLVDGLGTQSVGGASFFALAWALLFAYRHPLLESVLRSRVKETLVGVAREIRGGIPDRGHFLESLKSAGIAPEVP